MFVRDGPGRESLREFHVSVVSTNNVSIDTRCLTGSTSRRTTATNATRSVTDQNTTNLAVTEWADALFSRWGHHCTGGYVELFWLPVLGPSCVMLARHLSMYLHHDSLSFRGSVDELGAAVGIGGSSRLTRCLHRLASFGLAKPFGEPDCSDTIGGAAVGSWSVRMFWPYVSPSMVSRLPKRSLDRHPTWESLIDPADSESVSFWRFAVLAHTKAVSALDVDVALRHMDCPQDLRVQLVDWVRVTPRHGRPTASIN